MTDIVEIVERKPRVAHNVKWHGEREMMLRRLVTDGIGQTEIARQIGQHYNEVCTRNMIISAMAKFKLKCAKMIHAPGQSEPQPASSRNAERAVINKYKRSQGNHEAKPVQLIEPEIHPSDLMIPAGQRCTLVELTDVTCRWPVGVPGTGSFFFCGGKKPGDLRHPYCGHHERRAVDPLRGGWRR